MTGLYVLSGISLAMAAASLLLIVFLLTRKTDASSLKQEIARESDKLSTLFSTTVNMYNEMVKGTLIAEEKHIENALASLTEAISKNAQYTEQKFSEFNKNLEDKLEKIRADNQKSLAEVRADNEKQLEKMRVTVDEKLSSTLEARFNASFKLVSERLDAINQSFAELQNLQTGVNDLKKILGSVKSRGTWGEVSLDSLLSQILAPAQYARNVNISRSENERVDFVINLPGKNDDSVFLPIDAKFPVEDYLRLVDAAEAGNAEAAEDAAKAIERRIKLEATRIKSKYIRPPKTTDFAIMYLPAEGLFAEVLRRPGLCEQLQNSCRIVVCGPTTLAALLNSLQMGFKTVAIEKRSAEIWKLLAAFRKEFGVFSELLEKTQKKLADAAKNIGDANAKSEQIRKRLNKVDELPNAENPFEESQSGGFAIAEPQEQTETSEEETDNYGTVD
jgi:DNA recombination protein RmuC